MNSYEKEYHSILHKHLYVSSKYYTARAKIALKKYFEGISKEDRTLDFGCGMGQNIVFLKNAIGYDISKFSLDFCSKKGIKVTNKLSNIKDNSFEVIFSSHVLEHLENPFKAIQIMKKKLKKRGKLILILPVEKYKKGKFILDKNQHLYCWNFQTINNLLIKLGFTIIENKYLYGTGYKKLLFLNKLSFKLYNLFTKLIALILNIKEMKIVAIKK